MIVGRQVTLNGLNSTLSDVIIRLRDVLDEGRHLAIWAANHNDADLEAIGINDPNAVFLLRAAVQDLLKIAQVFNGELDQTPAHDFRQYTSLLTGTD